MRIGIDIMGGDFAPEATVIGVIKAYGELKQDAKMVLIGDENKIHRIFQREGFDASLVDIVHSTEVIKMGEHPAKTFTKKPNSSIAIGFQLLMKKEIDSFASAGNTGAVLVGTMYTVKSIPGIIRPCITVALPRIDGGSTIMLDVGINPDCRPDVLYQYAILGSTYAENVFGIKKPKVCLLNIGEEEEKGNLLTKASFELMKGSPHFNFCGNIEGNNLLLNDKADVIVCDGFTGNVVLKAVESIYTMATLRNIKDSHFDRFNFENYGGTPILGINSTVLIGHGISNPTAIKNMLVHSKDVVEAKLCDKIKRAFL